MNLVRIKEYCIEVYTRNTIDTIIMYTFILRLAIRMYTIELGKTSKTEIFFYLFLYIRALGGLAALGISDSHYTSLEPFEGAVQGAVDGTQSGTLFLQCSVSCTF